MYKQRLQKILRSSGVHLAFTSGPLPSRNPIASDAKTTARECSGLNQWLICYGILETGLARSQINHFMRSIWNWMNNLRLNIYSLGSVISFMAPSQLWVIMQNTVFTRFDQRFLPVCFTESTHQSKKYWNIQYIFDILLIIRVLQFSRCTEWLNVG